MPPAWSGLSEARSSDADLEELRRAAHTLKSNGRTFGATRLAALSEELELSAQTRTSRARPTSSHGSSENTPASRARSELWLPEA